MPTGKPPHKEEVDVIDPVHRYNMCRLAIKDNQHFSISDLELNRSGNTYTVDTIEELLKEDPDSRYSLIIGADSLMNLLKWKEPKRLFEICHFIVANRAGYGQEICQTQMDYLKENYNAKFTLIDFPNINISSSEIRGRIMKDLSIKYLVPKDVEEYIFDHNLYDLELECIDDLDQIETKLKKKLSTKRFLHSIGVRDTAIELAKIHCSDVKKATIAGLLHDCAKNYSHDKKLKLSKRYGIKLTKEEKKNPDLIHAKLGAYIAKYKYGVKDQEVLNAIECHTTGKPNMTLLEKIIFIADYIEPGRNKAPNLDKIRSLVKANLDDALVQILEDTVEHLTYKSKATDPRTKETLKHYQHLKEKQMKHCKRKKVVFQEQGMETDGKEGIRKWLQKRKV